MIIFPSILDKITTLKDGSLKLIIETPELSNEQVGKILELRNKQIFTAFNDTGLKPDELDIKEMPTEFKTQKSQSERLRSVLFVFWEKHKPTTDFNTFYNRKTEEFITMVKEKI